MVGSKRTKLYTAVFLLALLGAFLCFGFLRSYFWTSELGTILYMIIIGAWSFTIRRRILNEKCRSLLAWTCYGMMFWFLLRVFKYNLVSNYIILHYCWYLYYIPITVLPYLMFYLAVITRRLDKWALSKAVPYMGLLLIPINLIVLTNDYHQLVFQFGMPASKWRDGMPYSYGPFFYLVIIWAMLLGIRALTLLVQKSAFSLTRKLAWISLLPIVLGIFLLLLLISGWAPMVNGLKLYQLHEVICFMCIGFLEACIQIGLIPSNEGYEIIFSQSSVAAKIVDYQGNSVYESEQKLNLNKQQLDYLIQNDILLDKDSRYNSVPIQGGYFLWSEDLTTINQINEDLREAAEVLADENTMLEEENRLKEDEARFKTMNRLYDQIAIQVHSQVVQIEELLSQKIVSEDLFRKNLARAAFLNAYIKRRSNLALLAERSSKLDLEELYLSCKESLMYLAFCEKTTYIEPFSGICHVDSNVLFDAYDFMEYLIEEHFDSLSAVMMTVRARENQISVRLTLDLDHAIKEIPDTIAKVKIEEAEGTVIITLFYDVSSKEVIA